MSSVQPASGRANVYGIYSFGNERGVRLEHRFRDNGTYPVIENPPSTRVTGNAASTDWRTIAASFDAFCERRLGVTLLMATVVYAGAMVVQSNLKSLWYDELFTHMLAMLPLRRLWQALLAGAEVHPPLSMAAAHLFQMLAGPRALATRMPEILAFWGVCVAVFFVVRRHLGAAWGFAAALIICQSDAEYYATEARPYALVMCCAAVALLCWQKMAAGEKRWWCCAALALTMAASVSAHFMGVLVAVPIGLGELYRSWERRKIDAPFWTATVLGLSTILFYIPIMRSAQRYVAHNASGAGHTAPVWVLFVQPLLPLFPVVLIALLGLWIASGARHPERGNAVPRRDWIAAAGLCSLPLWQIALKPWTQAVNTRYTISFVIGAALLFIYVCAWLFGRTPNLGFACMCLVAVLVASNAMLHFYAVRKIPRWPPTLSAQTLPNLPILVDQGFHYFPLYWYNPELRSRIFYVASVDDALRVSGGDTVELNLLSERGWLPLQIADRSQFFYPGAHFLFYDSAVDRVIFPDWQMDTLRAMNARITVLQRLTPTDLIFEVECPQ